MVDEAALLSLHPDARAHVRAGRCGGLETRSRQPHSSQALCVDFFGALDQREGARDCVALELLERAGVRVPVEGSVEIRTEVRGRRHLLNEYQGQESAIDALLVWPNATVAVESKFAEHEFGYCSQAKWRHRWRGEESRPAMDDRGRVRDCSGDHALGSDLKPTTREESLRQGSPCRLTIQDGRRTPRRYWDFAPTLFRPEALELGRPCPFRNDSFQLMRNLAFAYASARERRQARFGFLAMYVHRARGASRLRERFATFVDQLSNDVRAQVGLLAYEDAIPLLASFGQTELTKWLEARVERGLASAHAAR